ncbi:GtrA family protein [Aquidulcibacter sp.]|jgi:putative flippase GtrA|uniref:GtrA family protein n=1 Tax=Aquidulcibacter sp. TaxID=2052990 RepID=UPI0028A70C13|nr:GtrA family protein [Aquidulcibacter sp.]
MTGAKFRAKAILGLRYAFAGGLTSLVYIIVYNLMVYLGLVRFFSSNLAYGAALLFQYSAHGKFTFGHRETKPGTLWRYLVAVGVGFLIAALISQANTKLYNLPDLVVSAIVMVIVAFTNFLFFNFWVYADQTSKSSQGDHGES